MLELIYFVCGGIICFFKSFFYRSLLNIKIDCPEVMRGDPFVTLAQ